MRTLGLIFYVLLAGFTAWMILSSAVSMVRAFRRGDVRRIIYLGAIIAFWTALIIFVFAAEMKWGHAISGLLAY